MIKYLTEIYTPILKGPFRRYTEIEHIEPADDSPFKHLQECSDACLELAVAPFYVEGMSCPGDLCNGILGYEPVENCYCHIGKCAPCGNCTDNPLVCLDCWWMESDGKSMHDYCKPEYSEEVECAVFHGSAISSSLTSGKLYEIISHRSERLFVIRADNGNSIHCLWDGCNHLRNRSWKKVIGTPGHYISRFMRAEQ